jgi:hypothetical protein
LRIGKVGILQTLCIDDTGGKVRPGGHWLLTLYIQQEQPREHAKEKKETKIVQGFSVLNFTTKITRFRRTCILQIGFIHTGIFQGGTAKIGI